MCHGWPTETVINSWFYVAGIGLFVWCRYDCGVHLLKDENGRATCCSRVYEPQWTVSVADYSGAVMNYLPLTKNLRRFQRTTWPTHQLHDKRVKFCIFKVKCCAVFPWLNCSATLGLLSSVSCKMDSFSVVHFHITMMNYCVSKVRNRIIQRKYNRNHRKILFLR